MAASMTRTSRFILGLAMTLIGCGSAESTLDAAGAGDAGSGNDVPRSTEPSGDAGSSGSNGPNGPSPTKDAGTSAPADAGDPEWPQTASCNSVANGATPIDVLLVTGQPPKMTGGTIVDGTYDLTSFRKFTSGTTGTNDTGYRETMVISNAGTKIERVMISKKLQKTGRATGTQVPTGTAVAVTYTCPQQGTINAEYTAGPNRFEVLADKGKEHYVYERR